MTLSSGVATFTDISFRKTSVVSLEASVGSIKVCASGITVTPGALSLLAFTTQPSSTATAGGTLTTDPVITAYDAYANVKTNFASSVSLTGNSGTGTCNSSADLSSSVNPTSKSAVSGVADFSGLSILSTQTKRLRATSGAITVCSSALTISAGAAATISVVSGNTQSGTAGSAVASPLVVLVQDSEGNPIPNATVTFAATGGGGSVSPTSTTTNASGQAQTTFTLGNTAGSNTAQATSGGQSVSFSATGVAGVATQFLINSGNNQTGTVNSALSSSLEVIALDTNNNPVSGVTVNWSVLTGGGSLVASGATTNSSGIASAVLTLGNSAGSNTARAAATGFT
ncbi:MAG: hypothetical protein EOP50_16980, partial [Sphingobacteriales bacterium]